MGLLTKEVEVVVNSRNVKYYDDLGYDIPKYYNKNKKKDVYIRGAKFRVNVNDLPVGSNYRVECECEVCKGHSSMSWQTYMECNHDGKTYCKTYKNLFYQFGRKDPLRAANVDIVTGSNLTTTISDSIQNPEKFYCLLNNDEENGMYDWCVEHASNLWDANRKTYTGSESSCIKTIYDPCPVGFIVPNVQWSYGFTDGVVSTTNASRFQVVGEFQNGWMMKRNPQDTQGIFMPASGYRDNASGNVGDVGISGCCWSVASYEPGFAYRLAFMRNYIGPLTGPSRTFGCSVRPVREL